MKKKLLIALIIIVGFLGSFFLGRMMVISEESIITKVVSIVTPSVVTISIKGIEGQDVGTGFVISDDGLIVTNKHVVMDIGVKYNVVIGKEDIVEVKDIYRDPIIDLAILKVEKKGLSTVKLGDSDKLKVGQTVIAIGTALGEFRSTVTTGVISGLGRGITAGSFVGLEKLDDVIQTDAAINPGNSGGPLLNSKGEVIGVSVAVSQNGQNIGFALPINLVKQSIANFKTTGSFERAYLGVIYKMIPQKGAYIQELVTGGPAEKAGIKVGDIILEVDGGKLMDSDSGDLVKTINRKKIGSIVEIKVLRENFERVIDVTLEKKTN